MTNEKIKKLQLEIAKTTEAQKKSEQKYKEKIKGLRDELKKEEDRKSTRLNSSHPNPSRMPSSA